jgi:ParB/RepB/Spo0J family partition protein
LTSELGRVAVLPVSAIRPDPKQPRHVFDEQALKELARSILNDGLQQYPIVRRADDGQYVLVAGERRWRACQLAGLTEIPCVVRDVDEARAFELAIIENVLRENLTPLEEAQAYDRLMRERGLTLEQLAQLVRKSIAYVEYRVRLLNLREEYRDALRRGILSLPQACDLARVPHEQQPVVFRMYRAGRDANDVARVITALLERQTQMELPVDPGEARQASDRLRKVLNEIAAKLGRCYSRKDLELLGWVLDGSVDRNLEMLRLVMKQLRQLEEHLRKAKARRAVRQPTMGQVDHWRLE